MNSFAGIALIGLGSIGAASFYVPFKRVKLWGIALKEWKGSTAKTMLVLLSGITILILSTFVVNLG